MKLAGSKKISIAVVVLVLLSGLGLIKSAKTALRIRQVELENSQLAEQVSQLTQEVEEKDEKIAADRELYTNLAGRLHKEMKKVTELEEELKKGKKRRR